MGGWRLGVEGKGVEEPTENKGYEPSIRNDQEYSEHLLEKNDREKVEKYRGSRRSKANEQELVIQLLHRQDECSSRYIWHPYSLPGTGLCPADYIHSHILTHSYGTGTVLQMGKLRFIRSFVQ